MPSERVGTFNGAGEVFLGEEKIADVDFSFTVSQDYQNIGASKFYLPVKNVEGTIRARSGTVPYGVELTLHYEQTWRLKFRRGTGFSIVAYGGPYEEKSPSPP